MNFDIKMSKIGPLLKRLYNKRTLIRQKKIAFINNFLIYESFVVVFGIYAFANIIIMAKIERK